MPSRKVESRSGLVELTHIHGLEGSTSTGENPRRSDLRDSHPRCADLVQPPVRPSQASGL